MAQTATQLQETLRRRAGGLDTNDPIYTNSNSLLNYINDAQTFLVLRTLRGDRKRLNLFRDKLRDRWHYTQIANQAYLDIPQFTLAVTDIYSYDLDIAQAEPNESLAKRRRLEEIEDTIFEGSQKTSTPTGWPGTWCRMENRIYFTPTPGTGYASWLLVRGLKVPPTLAGSDVSILGDMWQPALLDAAAYLLFKDLDWDQNRDDALEALDTNIINAVDVKGLGMATKRRKVRIKGMPSGY